MRVDVEELVPGMIMKVPIVKNDTLLVRKGSEITPHIINKLRNFGITSVDIYSEQEKIGNTNGKSNTIGGRLERDVREALATNDMKRVKNNASQMVSAVLKDVNFTHSFSDLKYNLQSFDKEDVLGHSIRVATFSIVLAHLHNQKLRKTIRKRYELDEKLIDLKEIAVSALLRDSSKNFYSDRVLDRVAELKKNEAICKILPGILDVPEDKFDDKFVSLYSFCLLDDTVNVSSNIKYMMLYSAETEKENGPLKAKGFDKNNTHSYAVGAKIINLASIYDDYLSHCIHTDETLENVVSVIGHAASHKIINEELTDLFFNNIPVYPVGNKVELSTGEQAEVIKVTPGYTYTTRPVVKTIPDGRVIDLKNEHFMTIIGVSKAKKSVDALVNDQLNEIDKNVRRF